MTTVAVTIQQAIDVAADNIAQLTFDNVVSIKTRMNTWIATMFGTIFVDTESANERTVINWRVWNDQANATIEGAGAGLCGLIGSSNVIDAVSRALCAVRDSTTAGYITTAQRALVITAFNASWT